MAELRFTPEQTAAITDRGGDLLVSAAAGSGKTRVLVERLMAYVTDPAAPCNVDDFLIITYTKAAAGELRSRITDQVAGMLAKTPTDRHLRRQSALSYRADISTIHAFCSNLIRENAHLLGIRPNFRVAETRETDQIQAAVLENQLEQAYETMDPDFALLADTMGAGRDDSRLVQIALDLYGKLKSHPDPDRWMTDCLAQWETAGQADAGATVWGRQLMADAALAVGYWIDRMEEALDAIYREPRLEKAYGESFSATLAGLRQLRLALEQSWDDVGAVDVPFPRLGAVRNFGDTALLNWVKGLRDRCKKEIPRLLEPFQADSQAVFADMDAVYPTIRGLFQLCMDFDRAYAAEKKRRNLLDFSDLEHLALALLTERETGAPTTLAREVSARYREVMVDEYQDANEIQERLFQALSCENSLFMVGDVKQSIYRFRLADPSIFLEKYRRFPPAKQAAAGEPRKILLSKNFRSRPEILEAVNFLFQNVMSPQYGEMAYTQEESLYPGADFATPGAPVELCLFDRKDAEDPGDEDKALAEARYVASRIRAMLDGGCQVEEKGTLRPLEYRDIAVLLRSPGTSGAVYGAALAEAGIPVAADQGEDFFKSVEIAVMTSFLAVIDNPMQDVPLISLLRSPLYGFTPDDLAAIRAGDRDTDFYTALCQAAETEPKYAAFLQALESLRLVAADLSTYEMLWQIYSSLGVLEIFGAMPGGAQRRQNLMALLQYAQQFESEGYRGVSAFSAYLRRMMERGEDLSVPPPSQEQAVRILSIHRSKGLEFPVVFLCDTGRQFNVVDTRRPLLIHQRLGIGPRRVDLDRHIQYATLPRQAITATLMGEMAAEELRVLYVALTRAQERLIVTYTARDAQREMERDRGEASLPIAPQVLKGAKSMGEILLRAALLPGSPWKLQIEPASAWQQAEGEDATPAAPAAPETAQVQQAMADIQKNLAYIYPHGAAVDLPSKLTATELKGDFRSQEAAEEGAPLIEQPAQHRPPERPAFMVDVRRMTPAERGTALHLAMQHMDYGRCGSLEAIQAQLQALVEKQQLTPAQAEAVDGKKIFRFFQSPLGRYLQSVPVRREFKFSLLVPAERYFSGGAGEEILLQGVVDCFVEREADILLLDYKTDRVYGDQVQARAESYRGQVEAYAAALETILKKPVTRRLLYFFAADQVVDLGPERDAEVKLKK